MRLQMHAIHFDADPKLLGFIEKKFYLSFFTLPLFSLSIQIF